MKIAILILTIWVGCGTATSAIVFERHIEKRDKDKFYREVSSETGCFLQDLMLFPLGPIGLFLALCTDCFTI